MSLLIRKPVEIKGRVTVTRSRSYKLQCENIGGAKFESRDFFACLSNECDADDEADVGEELDRRCARQIYRTLRQYMQEQAIRNEKKQARRAS